MYLADGGGGSAAPVEPTYSGPQRLRIDPSAIPGALAAFREAHERVSNKVKELQGLQVQAWSGDPVSFETAKQFSERTNSGGADSAIACLMGYQKQLQASMEALQASHDQYLAVEGTNTAQWGKYN